MRFEALSLSNTDAWIFQRLDFLVSLQGTGTENSDRTYTQHGTYSAQAADRSVSRLCARNRTHGPSGVVSGVRRWAR
jgi:hypothetical protein